ncbi:MAG: hypothetical protein DLM69_08830 [Candidatus Chloroheliales bacterium]|nr:MAG: hypothetical protein DLM69_08830 [Chloroflexota bacterium]
MVAAAGCRCGAGARAGGRAGGNAGQPAHPLCRARRAGGASLAADKRGAAAARRGADRAPVAFRGRSGQAGGHACVPGSD